MEIPDHPDIDRTLHVGGYPACAVFTVKDDKPSLYKANLRPDTAINLARALWRNQGAHQMLDEVRVVNQKTMITRDTIGRV